MEVDVASLDEDRTDHHRRTDRSRSACSTTTLARTATDCGEMNDSNEENENHPEPQQVQRAARKELAHDEPVIADGAGHLRRPASNQTAPSRKGSQAHAMSPARVRPQALPMVAGT